MAPLKKAKKGVKAAKEADAKATTSPKLSPKTSPAAAPKTSPKLSPKLSPKASPAAAPKANAKLPTDAEKAAATKKANELIKKGLVENPTAQDNGHPYIPKEWSADLKPILGAYRKFLERSTVFVVVQGDTPAKFTVRVNDGKGQVSTPRWEVTLRGAWQKYLQDTPKEDRDAEAFMQLATKCSSTLNAASGPKTKGKDAASKGKKRKQSDDDGKSEGKKKAGVAKKAAKEENGDAAKAPKKKKMKKAAA